MLHTSNFDKSPKDRCNKMEARGPIDNYELGQVPRGFQGDNRKDVIQQHKWLQLHHLEGSCRVQICVIIPVHHDEPPISARVSPRGKTYLHAKNHWVT